MADPIRGWIDIEVRDRNGRLIRKSRHKMGSFVNNFLRIIYGFMSAKGGAALIDSKLKASASVVSETGSTATVYIESYREAGKYRGGGVPMGCKAAGGVDSYGICAGTGIGGEFKLSDYSLLSKLTHGTGTNNLVYGACDYVDLGLDTNVTPNVYRFRISRVFTNSSGATITVTEVGLFARSYWKHSTGVDNDVKYMIAKDLLPESYEVPNGGTITVYYTIEVELA